MSDGFAGANTKSVTSFQREVEARMKSLDIFKDDFSPPGTGELGPGENPNKPDNGYGAVHSENAALDSDKAQSAMDDIDEEVQQREGGIPSIDDEVPRESEMSGPEGFDQEIEKRMKRLQPLKITMVKKVEYKAKEIEVWKTTNIFGTFFGPYVDGKPVNQNSSQSIEQAVQSAKAKIDKGEI